MARVMVLHARLGPGAAGGNSVPGTEFPAGLLELLPYGRRLELGRRDRAGRYASLAGIWLTLDGAAALRGRAVAPSALRFPAAGKPRFEGGPYFSISHAANHVAVALSDDLDIGLDIEALDQPSPGGEVPRRRLERWTATEAVLKAAGRGLREVKAVELDELLASGTLAGAAFRLTPLSIAPDLVAHLATPQGVEPPTVELSSRSSPR